MRTQSLTLQTLDKDIVLSSQTMSEISKYFVEISLSQFLFYKI